MSAQNHTASGAFGALLGMVGLSAVAGVLATVMVTPAIAVTGIAASNTIGIFEQLPEYIELGELSQRNTLYAQNTANPADGYTEIAKVYFQNREEVGIDGLPQAVIDATIAGEDRRFYEHNGVDVQSVVRAALGNVTSGDIESGASTLTMQLVKNICIQDALNFETDDEQKAGIAACQESSLERKLNEAKLAINLEKQFEKDEILVAYLNIAGFGGNTYGIQAAAQEYFSINAVDATIAQAASLIAIVQQPGARSLKSPENYAANQERRDIILGNMLAYGSITKAEYDEAIAIPVDENFVKPSAPQSGCMAANDYAKFFCDYVVRNVKNYESLGADAAERAHRWKTGGLDVYTTLNMSLQNVAQEQLWAHAPYSETAFALGAVATSVEPGTGRVLTMAQNKVFNNTEEGGGPGATAVNFVTDREYGGSSGFQVGSTYKVFALLEWLQQGRGLNEVVDASTFEYPQSVFADSCNGPWNGPPFKFGNDAGESGTRTPYTATTGSVNSAFVSMATQLDQCGIRDTAMSLGVHRADGTELQSNPSAVLGTNEIAPLTMAAAFAGIANNGKYCAPIVVDKFVEADGTELPGQAPSCDQGIAPEVAATAAYAMYGAMHDRGGTGLASNPRDGIPIIGKTGTTDRSRHTWVVTATTEVATAVWVGNIVGDYRIRRYTSPTGVNGGQIRHVVMKAIAAAANAQYGGNAFPEPDSRLLRGSGIEMPDIIGQTVPQARAILEGLGLRLVEEAVIASSQPAGTIAIANPAPGSIVGKGLTVRVQVSDGSLAVVPDVSSAGYDEAQARAALQALGFTTIKSECVPINGGADPAREGIVETQDPAPGTEGPKSIQITLGVASSSCGSGGGGGGLPNPPAPPGGGD